MSLLLCLVLLQDVADAKIGDVNPHAPIGSETILHYAPSLDRAISSNFFREKETFRLENGVEESRPVKWVGWKMPDRQSLLLARVDDKGEKRRLLVAGVEDKSHGEIWDAELLKDGTLLAVVVKTPQGRVLQNGDQKIGPFESIDLLGVRDDQPIVLIRHQGKGRLHVAGKEFECEGRPTQFFYSPKGGRVAWIEQTGDKKFRAVVDGKPGAVCDAVQNGIHFSPNGEHVAYVTREAGKHRGWVDGDEIRSDQSVVTARAFSDGTRVWVEMWRNKDTMQGRIVVDGKRQDRILPRPIFHFDFQGEKLCGASRTETDSVIARVTPSGEVSYEDVQGRVGRILAEPGGDRCMYSVLTKEGYFIQIDKTRRGPYDKAEFFYLTHTKRFGYVAEKGQKVTAVVGGKSIDVPLQSFSSPIAISEDEMTAAIVGIYAQKNKKEIWVRAIPLE
jgi:hypothetical protein